ncbi:hypothetical protein [Peribacillus butanolivorans]|uniref:hypothetical protein n=1 Tax=Peribacillus butanolivorans TaxID=421767 RepID=UPI00366E43F4
MGHGKSRIGWPGPTFSLFIGGGPRGSGIIRMKKYDELPSLLYWQTGCRGFGSGDLCLGFCETKGKTPAGT